MINKVNHKNYSRDFVTIFVREYVIFELLLVHVFLSVCMCDLYILHKELGV